MISKITFLAGLIFISVLLSQGFREVPPPRNLQGRFSNDTVYLWWGKPAGWDSLRFDIYRAIVFDTTSIYVEFLEFSKIQSTTKNFAKEAFRQTDNLSHLAFLYYVVSIDTNGMESVRSNYFFVNLKE